MERVLEERDRAGVDLAPETVHGLRVALRRCRTMADGLMQIDSDKCWKAMKKEGRRLFKRLGALRDVQIMMDWVHRLAAQDDPAAARLLEHLNQREAELKQEALEALRDFDERKWRGWIRRLHPRSRRVPLEGRVFQLSALQAWESAYHLHRQAMRNRSETSFHRLRIGLKKFRYTIENFLPRRHSEWGAYLKNLQDCLGELHDLVVLWRTGARIGAFADEQCKSRWRTEVDNEKAKRIGFYREKMLGPESMWMAWRSGLLSDRFLRQAALQRFEKWAFFLGADIFQTRRVLRLALQMFGGLNKAVRADVDPARAGDRRAILRAAAIMRAAGKSGLYGKINKSSSRLLRRLPPLPGLPAEYIELAALVARCLGGGLRIFDDPEYRKLPSARQQAVLQMAGILRLAITFARIPDGRIRRLSVQCQANVVEILASDYSSTGPMADKLARERYLLELACGHPVLIHGNMGTPHLST